MKKDVSQIKIWCLVLGLSLLMGEILSLGIGLTLEKFIQVSIKVVVLDSLSLGFAVLGSLYLSRYLTEKTKNLLLILLLSFGLMLGTGILTFIAFFVSNPASFLYTDNRNIPFLLINLLFFIAFSIIISGFVFFQYTILEKEKALNEEKILKIQMELKLLASKINPHFLFNSLNLLVSLLKTPDKAETALINLAEILRYQLDFTDVKTISPETELNMVEKYLAIQKMRFGKKLTYDITCDARSDIPPLLIQPLVENCIKHNIDQVEHLHIDVLLTESRNKIAINIMDSLAILKPEMLDKGVGLTVTKKRVEHLGGTFLIQNGGIEISFKS